MECLRPKKWLSAHLHVKFVANVKFSAGFEVEFRALDKPTNDKNRLFAEIIDQQETEGQVELFYDPLWINILRQTQKCIPLSYNFDPSSFKDEEVIPLKDVDLKIPGYKYAAYKMVHP